MMNDDMVDAALAAALASMVPTIDIVQVERVEVAHFRVMDGNLLIEFFGAARLNEIQPAFAIMHPSGCEYLSIGVVQTWLEEPIQAYMFGEGNLVAACHRAVEFAERAVRRYRQDPIQAKSELDALAFASADRFLIDEIRRGANEAWTRQDFALVGTLYEKISDHLTPVERKRLDIAKKRTSG